MKKMFFVLILLIITLSTPFFVSAYATSRDDVIETSSIVGLTSYRDLWEAYQQRSFYAEGRFWVFYYNGSNGSHDHLVYVSSTDGKVWSQPVQAISESIDASHSYSIWFDGVYVHNFVSCAWGTVLMYERGLPCSNGTIVWSNEQIIIGKAYDYASATVYLYPQGCVDSNGYPWIVYEKCNSVTLEVTGSYVIKSSTNDGTWKNAANFPYYLANSTSGYGIGQGVYPLTNGKVAVICVTSGFAYLTAWDGNNWLKQIQSSVNIQGDQYGYFTWSAVSQDDYVHFLYGTTSVNYGIGYELYDYKTNNFSQEIVVAYDADISPWAYTTTPMTLDKETGILYAFWVDPTSGLSDKQNRNVVYKRCINGVWDTCATILSTELENDILCPLGASAFYYVYNDYIGVMYTTGITDQPPFNISFVFISISDLKNDSEPEIDAINDGFLVMPFSFFYVVIIILFVVCIVGFIVLNVRNNKKR